jgi:hypothetical protein
VAAEAADLASHPNAPWCGFVQPATRGGTSEGRLEAPYRRADGGFRLHDKALYGSSQLRDQGTRLPVKITPTTVMADDGGVCDVIPFSRHRCCRSRHHARDALGETLDLGLPDCTMMASSMLFSLPGASF